MLAEVALVLGKDLGELMDHYKRCRMDGSERAEDLVLKSTDRDPTETEPASNLASVSFVMACPARVDEYQRGSSQDPS